ncbi:putative F-box protein At1g53370 [Aegilops tauschii subsp. strangulata]|uniref:putative F-box protein At1g53370 n=1 Tax=Aegilops tauschii subsp. strangulata TaxID=200361 RepID=UPI00098ADD7C|nr:putative F-box protein At3g52320 [Aegilops tauschii subsp. strangulata]
MAMDDAGRRELPTDVLVEILLRLPPSSRRRVRLVCRLWRDIIDERTTEMHSCATALLWDIWDRTAYVVDDLSKSSTGKCRKLWKWGKYGQLVGTCNGLLCLCDMVTPGGAVTLVNPATGETLPVPPLPCVDKRRCVPEKWYEAYSFGYHPTSGQYKVVHVPCSFDLPHVFDTVHVLTLGEASWREVPEHDGWCKCDLSAGIVSVDGTTYWVLSYGAIALVVAFDLEHERVTFLEELPAHIANVPPN